MQVCACRAMREKETERTIENWFRYITMNFLKNSCHTQRCILTSLNQKCSIWKWTIVGILNENKPQSNALDKNMLNILLFNSHYYHCHRIEARIHREVCNNSMEYIIIYIFQLKSNICDVSVGRISISHIIINWMFVARARTPELYGWYWG